MLLKRAKPKTITTLLIVLSILATLMMLTAILADASDSTRKVVLGGVVAPLAHASGTNEQYYWGSGCWAAVLEQKFEIYIDPTLPPFNVLGSFKIDDIASISYHTNTPHAITGETPNDFYLVIYTKPDNVNDHGWYGYKLIAEPYFSENLNAPANQWSKWSTDEGTNQLTFFDPDTIGFYGFYGQPTFQEIQAGSINWHDYYSGCPDISIDYGVEVVKYISFQTGTGWMETFQGYIDAITIALNNGISVTIDLEGYTSEVWVDDDWTGSSPGVEVETGKYIGYNAYATIQEGINAVAEGGTVNVVAGTYEEGVVINKTLTLRGENRETTEIKFGYGAYPSSSPLTISADGVTVSGITIRSGPYIEPAWTIVVKGNNTLLTELHVIKESLKDESGDPRIGGAAIILATELFGGSGYGGIDGFTFTDSIVDSAWDGIYAPRNPGSSNIIVRNVNFTYPGEYGILLMMTSGATIEGNTFTCTANQYGVIVTRGSDNIEILSNQFVGSGAQEDSHIGILLQAYAEGTMGSINISENEINNFNIGVEIENMTISGDVSVSSNEFQNNTIQVSDEAEVLNVEQVLEENTFDRAVVIEREETLLHTIYSQIQNAIDVASSGDTVLVHPGIYREYLHITTDFLTVEGAGIDESIIDLEGLIPYWHYPDSESFASRAGVLISGYGSTDEIVEGVTFKGFTVKNAGLNPPIPYPEFTDEDGDGQDNVRGISIHNGKNIIIQYCKVINSGYYGISVGKARCTSLKQSENVTIDHCISSDNHETGISVGDYVGAITITNNICSDNKRPHPNPESGREYSGKGIEVSGKDASHSISGLISNNTCSNNGYQGIVLKKYSNGVIIEDNTVTGHNIDDDGAGIFFYGASSDPANCKNNIIRNNTVTGNIRGIVAYYAQECTIEGNTITTDSGNFDPGQAAIKIDGGNNIVVKNNIISSCDGVGIKVQKTWDGVDCYNNIFTNNTITGAKFAGIFISHGAHDNIFEYNTITGTATLTRWSGKDYEETQGDGVFLWGYPGKEAGTGNVFHYNNIYGNDGDGMENQLTTEVNATLNWWGNLTGPGGVASGSGDAVTDNVEYSPWLTRVFQTVYEDRIAYFGWDVPLAKGWDIFSTPISLEGKRFFGDIVNENDITIVYRFDPATQRWVQILANDMIQPLEAVYVRSKTDTVARITLDPTITPPPMRQLHAGWNLIGPAPQTSLFGEPDGSMPVDQALVSVETAGSLKGYTIVVSPQIHQESWTYTVGADSPPPLRPYRGT